MSNLFIYKENLLKEIEKKIGEMTPERVGQGNMPTETFVKHKVYRALKSLQDAVEGKTDQASMEKLKAEFDTWSDLAKTELAKAKLEDERFLHHRQETFSFMKKVNNIKDGVEKELLKNLAQRMQDAIRKHETELLAGHASPGLEKALNDIATQWETANFGALNRKRGFEWVLEWLVNLFKGRKQSPEQAVRPKTPAAKVATRFIKALKEQPKPKEAKPSEEMAPPNKSASIPHP